MIDRERDERPCGAYTVLYWSEAQGLDGEKGDIPCLELNR
jgi:hypothetical protein